MKPTAHSSSTHRAVNPEMVILGRESRGLSQKELADALQVTQSRVSKIEAGLLSIPDDLLVQLSRVLDYPPQFFFREGARPGIGIAEVFHRKHKDVLKGTMTAVYANIDARLFHLVALLRAAEFPCLVPRLPIEEYAGDGSQVARLVRSMWEMPHGPVANVTQTLEDAGAVVIRMNFGTRKVDAVSRWVPGLPPMMFVNEDVPVDRLRLSEVHELAHLVMHEHPNPDIEAQAFKFAAEFLMPASDIYSDLTNLNLPKLAILKAYWKVSMAALLKRAEDLGAITPNRARYLWAQMGSAGYKTREPVDLDLPGERPTLVQELIDTHRKDLGYSVEDLAELLALNEDELWSFYLREPSHGTLRVIHGGTEAGTGTDTPPKRKVR